MFKEIFTHQVKPLLKVLTIVYGVMSLALIGFHFTPYGTGIILMVPMMWTPILIAVYFWMAQFENNQLHSQFNVKRKTAFLCWFFLLLLVVTLMTVVNFILATIAIEPLVRWEYPGTSPWHFFFPMFYFGNPLQMLLAQFSLNLAVGSLGFMIPYLHEVNEKFRFLMIPLILLVVQGSIFDLVHGVFESPVLLPLTMFALSGIFLGISFWRNKKTA